MTQPMLKLLVNHGFTVIDDYETYYRTKAIINNYIVYVKQVNGDQKIETGKLSETEEEIRETLQEQGITAIKNMLDQQYIKEMSINDETLKLEQNKYKQNNDIYNLNIKEIFETDIVENISIVLVNAELNNKDLKMIIKLDKLNNTYSIFLKDYMEKFNYNQNMNKKDINISTEPIKANSYNSKIKINATETYILSQYFSEYRTKMINDTKKAYELLNKEYREQKYGSYEKFEEYIKNSQENILYASIDKYQVTEHEGIKEYICVDTNGKYYIFMENDITNYEVVLDTYTIDLPDFLEKYNNYSDDKKCGMNIQKIFDAVNDGDYNYVYNKLDDTFKQNNFRNEESFKRYAEKYLKNNQLKYDKCEKSGDLYIYDVTIIENNNNTIQKTFIMKLLEGTDFVFSFNVE